MTEASAERIETTLLHLVEDSGRHSASLTSIDQRLATLNGSVARHEKRLTEIDSQGSQVLPALVRAAIQEHISECPQGARLDEISRQIQTGLQTIHTRLATAEAERKGEERVSARYRSFLAPAAKYAAAVLAALLFEHGSTVVNAVKAALK